MVSKPFPFYLLGYVSGIALRENLRPDELHNCRRGQLNYEVSGYVLRGRDLQVNSTQLAGCIPYKRLV
jgi:hypothetical protein